MAAADQPLASPLAHSIAVTLRNQLDGLRKLADTERGDEADAIVRRVEQWFARWWVFRSSSSRQATGASAPEEHW